MSARERILTVLEQLMPDLINLEDEVYVIGASAMILSGVVLESTPDIDLLTSGRDAETLGEKWLDKVLTTYSPADDHLFRSTFGRYRWNLMDVEVMGHLEVYSEERWQALVVRDYVWYNLKNGRVRLPSLPEQVRILKLFGREKDHKRIALIEAMMRM